MNLFLIGILIIAASGLLSLFWDERQKSWLVMAGTWLGSLAVIASAVRMLLTVNPVEIIELPLGYPLTGMVMQLDPLAGFFLVVIGIGAIFGTSYLVGYIKNYLGHRRTISTHFLFLTAMIVSMMVLTVVRHVLAFLIVWEIMSLSSFFLMSLENDKTEVSSAGLNYLVMMHISVVFLLFGFVMLSVSCNGAMTFDAVASAIKDCPQDKRNIILVLLLSGFGIKAGMWPFHSWMAQTYPAAPNHVAALMSGVMSKMGIFGIMLTLKLVGMPSAWMGYAVLVIGGLSALTGIVYALAQTDIKRIVAYSSVENIGIIFMGIGSGILGSVYHNDMLIFCGFGGALFHVLNHSLFKGLLFYCTGVICTQAKTRDIEHLGGLAKKMPVTAAVSLVGSMAISALPPFNGFASEFLIYLGLLGGMKGNNTLLVTVASLAIMVLALTGALALICFTRFFGIIFLGHPRCKMAGEAAEPSKMMLLPMVGGALGCVAAGFAAVPILKILGNIAGNLDGSAWNICNIPVKVADDLQWMLRGFGIFLAIMLSLLLLRRWLLGKREIAVRDTWGCGYDRPSARIQYTGLSYSLPLIRIVNKLFRNELEEPPVRGIFPDTGKSFSYRAGDLFDSCMVRPAVGLVQYVLGKFTWIQNGNIQYYILYGITFLILVIIGVFMW